ncbi:7857_t:CDS:2 [Paraglomus brasilianum]|uniref:7857_t:CDS:1 n=1 Tax=Paraglomus brasilianum TaxID=144538 RepID=A0A9N9FFE1_9GLOM|nr:7857_t:CDS:2 [Paraglomus brasilianum]
MGAGCCKEEEIDFDAEVHGDGRGITLYLDTLRAMWIVVGKQHNLRELGRERVVREQKTFVERITGRLVYGWGDY